MKNDVKPLRVINFNIYWLFGFFMIIAVAMITPSMTVIEPGMTTHFQKLFSTPERNIFNIRLNITPFAFLPPHFLTALCTLRLHCLPFRACCAIAMSLTVAIQSLLLQGSATQNILCARCCAQLQLLLSSALPRFIRCF